MAKKKKKQKDNFYKGLPIKGESLSEGMAVYDIKTAKGRQLIMEASAKAVQSYQGISASHVDNRTTYKNIDTNLSVRSQFTRRDYEGYRPSEAIPIKPKDVIAACMQAYRQVGIVKNVIDLMGDFGSQGVELVHPDPVTQKFFRNWFKMVGGKERSERFLNLLYRTGNVFPKKSMGKISLKDEKLMRSLANLDEDEDIPAPVKNKKRNIPIKYTFLNPLAIVVLDEELAQFIGSPLLGFKINPNLRNQLSRPGNALVKKIAAKLGSKVVKDMRDGNDIIPLDPDKVTPFYYKKDDWRAWADPLIYAIIDDLMLLEKMKLADLAALDSTISQIRIWTLGDLEHGIFPTNTAFNKLNDILLTNGGGGPFDILWGPDLKVDELTTDIHKVLGSGKYEAPLNNIHAGLGVPPTLTGSNGTSGVSNNFISLQTLINRLEYGRMLLTTFWEQEIEIVRKAMGFKVGAKVIFDNMILTDAAAEKALLIQLWDRNIYSDEAILSKFNEDADLELFRKRKEERQRKRGSKPLKAGPYFNPEKAHDLIKIALQKGIINPEDVGIDVDSDEDTPFDRQLKSIEQRKNKGVSGEGRPKNSKDKGKRKTSVEPKPRGITSSATDLLTKIVWAKGAQNVISDILNPVLLKYYKKDNLRKLSLEETESMGMFKLGVLSKLEYGVKPTKEEISKIMKGGVQLSPAYSSLYNKFIDKVKINRTPSLEDKRVVQSMCYAVIQEIKDVEN